MNLHACHKVIMKFYRCLWIFTFLFHSYEFNHEMMHAAFSFSFCYLPEKCKCINSQCFNFNVNLHIAYQKEMLIYTVLLMTIFAFWYFLSYSYECYQYRFFILFLNIKLSNSVMPGWPWWSECSSSANDMEDSRSRHSLWRSKGWH